MGKSPRTGRRLLPPMYSRKATDQTQETTCTVQSCCYLHGRVILMIGQIQQQQGRNIQFQKIEIMYYKFIFSFGTAFSINQYTTMPYIRPTRPGRVDPAKLTQADLTRGRLDPDSTNSPQSQPLVKDCQFGVSPVNYSDSDLYITFKRIWVVSAQGCFGLGRFGLI